MFKKFKKGMRVVYPHHGVGIIESIQMREAFSEKKQYYILKLISEQLTVSVPVNNSGDLGLRGIIDKGKATKVLKVLKEKGERADDNNERFRLNNDKVGSGDPFAIAEVVRDLGKQPELPSREKKMLSKARDLLISELQYSFEKTEQEMIKRVDKILAC